MKIYNTLTRQKEPFDKAQGERINMFVCGPTVYDRSHVGHARTYIAFDVVAKYLRYRGYEVFYLQNITDIDDKIIARAKENKETPFELATRFTEEHFKDMEALGITDVKYAKATEYIPEIIDQVKRLIDKDYAYIIEDEGYYFDLSKLSDYGKLSGRTMQGAEDATSRIDESTKKKNKGDFALWKFSSNEEPGWNSELGYGRPGWHIEDTAISEKYFGPQYDIHGGARDLIFPHHEAEIAQQESASGLKPFVKYWMHSGFVSIDNQKMSKSLNNFITIRELLGKYSPEVLRFAILQTHYRSPINFSYELLDSAKVGLENLLQLKRSLDLIKHNGELSENEDAEISNYKDRIIDALDDDFNTAEALGLISALSSQIFTKINSKSLDNASYDVAVEIIKLLDKVFGIMPKESEIPEQITKMVSDYNLARQNKDFTTSDQLRNSIQKLGYTVEDTVYGPLIKKN